MYFSANNVSIKLIHHVHGTYLYLTIGHEKGWVISYPQVRVFRCPLCRVIYLVIPLTMFTTASISIIVVDIKYIYFVCEYVFAVHFRYVVFRPFMDEILIGRIRSCSKEGVHG